MDFDFNFDLSEFDDEMAELNEAAKEIDFKELDKIFNEIMFEFSEAKKERGYLLNRQLKFSAVDFFGEISDKKVCIRL